VALRRDGRRRRRGGRGGEVALALGPQAGRLGEEGPLGQRTQAPAPVAIPVAFPLRCQQTPLALLFFFFNLGVTGELYFLILSIRASSVFFFRF